MESAPERKAGRFTVNTVGLSAPLRWLALSWRDLWSAPGPCLAYGLGVAASSFALAYAVYTTNAAFWALVLTCGFVFVAPMLAMGLYAAGRSIERGEKPTLRSVLFVESAFRLDAAYLGLALLWIYLTWGRIAQIVYGLSTYALHRTIRDFAVFAVTTSEGHNMLLSGSIVGGVIAFFTYCLVVVSAPMLLDRDVNVFEAVFTSFRTVAANPGPMALWAVIIAVLTLSTAATAFAALTLVFPWLGLASWRAYRDLVRC